MDGSLILAGKGGEKVWAEHIRARIVLREPAKRQKEHDRNEPFFSLQSHHRHENSQIIITLGRGNRLDEQCRTGQ